jgi:hypothetical protein
MPSPKTFCCNAYRLAGQNILDVPNAQGRDGLDDRHSVTEVYGLSQAPSRKTD